MRQRTFGPTLFHTIQRDQHCTRCRTLRANHFHRLAYRGARRDHIVNDDHAAFKLCADDGAAFAMILCFLAVISKRHVMAFGCERHCGCRGQRDALVRWTKQHIETHPRIQQGLRVKVGELSQPRAIIKQTGIEKIG